MTRRLPPLNSVRAFEVAARHLSFSKAAEELFVTQGAVSKQIKILEDFLGLDLFKRSLPRIVLTHEGMEYHQSITKALFAIETATSEIAGERQEKNTLTINILPSLSYYWLIPKIEEFKAKYPNIKLRIITGMWWDIDFRELDADVVIRGGETEWPENVQAERLLDEELALVYGPRLAAKNPIKKIEDVGNYTLLEHTPRPEVWPNFFAKHSLPNFDKKEIHSAEHFFMLDQAITAGLGIAMIPKFLVIDKIKSGELINPLNITMKTNVVFSLLYLKQKKDRRKIEVFSKWIKQVAKKTEALL